MRTTLCDNLHLLQKDPEKGIKALQRLVESKVDLLLNKSTAKDYPTVSWDLARKLIIERTYIALVRFDPDNEDETFAYAFLVYKIVEIMRKMNIEIIK